MVRNWAIAIGINEYDYLAPLNYAKRDAEAFRAFCFNQLDFEEVYYFSDDSPPIQQDYGSPMRSQPTYGTLSRFLRARFEEKFLGAGDNIWFFFAGHGKRHLNRDYLMPSDADPGNIQRTAISINYISERLRRCGADNVILFLDACRNEGDRDGEGVGVEKQQGIVTFFSCSPNERSYEIDEFQHGSFTYSLLQALRIQGKNNCATVDRLYQYLRNQVPEINSRYKKPRQTPYTIAEPATKLHLILLPKQATPTDVSILKADAFEAEAEGKLELAEQLWIRVLEASIIDNQAINAIKRIALKTSKTQADIQTEFQPDYTSNSRSSEESSTLSTNYDKPNQKASYVKLSNNGAELANLAKTEKKFTYAKLAEVCCISKSTILRFFKQEMLDTRKFEIICEALGLVPESVTENHSTTKSDSNETISLLNIPPQILSSSFTTSTFKFEVVSIDQKGQEIQRNQQTAGQYIEKRVSLELVLLPGGRFLMGSPETEERRLPNEGPQHSVVTKPFLIGKYPVTQAQWKAVATLNTVNRDLELDPSHFKGANLPVEQVSWYDAVEFCLRLSRETGHDYRLPTEAEWEYACRAGTKTPFHFGETITSKLANYDSNYSYRSQLKGNFRKKTTPVEFFPLANAFGLFDMHGNVWEWCLDCWSENYNNALSDGQAWFDDNSTNLRLLRGGSWYNDPRDCRSAFRKSWDSNDKLNRVGFRVVCVAK
ncbi:hypothetical protein DSM106972_033580 [Dulcicalothrix desertica PCC 7102]|uniref:Peptidase C14 n=1 Tax=Dulcicalothrix desertica PCC 7102 TaxID=232991 RepID=A0A3S1CPW8_9CYAN|nr:SUMF1/EgtB/PvdO family nonheme iron enzyme [Dulcicalothrix desertica]RUT06152.1 hypothetical protein DSM106972_033580 [Dulcicalothrix desertica PCC 7102]TWH54189.1 formylglycine-generating enzyme required for sulfatase activity [Dulcicalothrix desertica PCC 7102]